MHLKDLNKLQTKELKEALVKCCGSSVWVNELAITFPIHDKDELYQKAEDIWFNLAEKDWREAFTHHPKIGDINSLKDKYKDTAEWAAGEQKGVEQSSADTILQLSEANQQYEDKFGYIFIVCATGKSAEEMLHILNARLENAPEVEIKIAVAEQNKITRIRLEKLLAE